MPSDVISLRPTFDSARVELSSPGTQRGLPFYVVDIVEADGGRACMWTGTDYLDALTAVMDVAGEGYAIDATGPAPCCIVAWTVH